MDSIPQDVWPLIISFMTDKTKRVMRLASTTWLNLIKYNNFTLYFTRDEDLSAISERLSRYSWPISLTFEKHKLINISEMFRNITNLTNLTSMKAEKLNLDVQQYKARKNNESDCMRLSTLTNIERWEFLPIYLPLELFRRFTKLKLWNHLVLEAAEAVNPLLKELTNIDTLSYHEDATAWPFSFVSNPGKLTALEFHTQQKDGLSEGQMWCYLTNLKRLDCTDMAYTRTIDLKSLTALEECILSLRHLPSFEHNLNLTRLWLECYEFEEDKNFETVSKLSQLRRLELSVKECSDLWIRPLAHLPALQEFHLYFADDGHTDFFQYLPTTLKSLSLNTLVDLATLTHLVNLETLETSRGRLINDHLLSHFSNLTKLLVFVADEQFRDRSKIATLTKLKDLYLYVTETKPLNINFEELVNLTKFNSSQGTAWPSQVYNGFSKLTKLQWLDLRIAEDEANHDFLSGLTQLTHLKLQGTARDESFWNNLTNLKNLRELTFDRISFDDNVFDLAKLTNLTKLHLAKAAFGFTGCHITLLTTLQLFELSGPNEFQYDKEHLLKVMPYLYRADISMATRASANVNNSS